MSKQSDRTSSKCVPAGASKSVLDALLSDGYTEDQILRAANEIARARAPEVPKLRGRKGLSLSELLKRAATNGPKHSNSRRHARKRLRKLGVSEDLIPQ